MIAVGHERTPPGAERGRRVAAAIELAVLVTLLVFLGIAAGKLFLLLGRMGVSTGKAIPVGALFVVAAVLIARRISLRLRGFRRGEHDGSR